MISLALLVALAETLGFSHAPRPILDAIAVTAPDDATARLMVVWGVRESALRNDAVGDGGHSRCFLQVRDVGGGGGALDPVQCSRVWLGRLRYAEGAGQCGTRRAALGMLATGHCGGAPRLVARRLEAAAVQLP